MSELLPTGFCSPEEARKLWVMGDELRFMGSLAGTPWHVMDVIVPAGSGTPPHRHDSPEVFLVREGEVTFGVLENGHFRYITGRSGCVVTVPSGAPHHYLNRSGGPARFSVMVETQMKAFFEAVGSPEPPPSGPPSEAGVARILAACAQHGIEILEAA